MAGFGVISYALMDEIKRQRENKPKGYYHLHPDDSGVLVDIVDYVVLSENRIDTFFPNAKPGYEYMIPAHKRKQ